MKKNKKIVIAIIVFAILILVVGIALAFVLKSSNKEEFFKYAAQIFDSENGFIDKKIEQYNEKKATNTYENSGKITFNIPTENMDSKTATVINNSFNITFMGNVDEANQKVEELFKINYSKEDNFPVLYKKLEDVQAIKLSKIVKKYLGFDSSKNNLLSNFGVNTNIIDSIGFTAEEKDKIKNEYLQIFKDNLKESNFSKVSTSDSNGYVLEIQNNELQEIIVKILEKVKDDEQLLNKFKLNSSVIDSIMNNINLEDGKTTITIYQSNKELNRIIIEFNDSAKIDIKKTKQNDNLEYNIGLTLNQNGNDITALVVIGFSGLDSLETVTENYNLGIDINGYSYTYNIDNEVSFTDVEIKDFKENEFVDINSLSAEKSAQLFNTIIEKFNEINNGMMEKVNIKPENFWNNLLPKYYAPETDGEDSDTDFDLDDFKKDNTDKDEENDDEEEDNATENTIDTAKDVSNSAKNELESDNLASAFSETEKKTFNSKYTEYEGDEVKGSKVKTLIMQIIANNMADEEKQIKVTGDIKLTGNEVPESLDTSKTYTVKFKKSDDGYVNEAKITENE